MLSGWARSLTVGIFGLPQLVERFGVQEWQSSHLERQFFAEGQHRNSATGARYGVHPRVRTCSNLSCNVKHKLFSFPNKLTAHSPFTGRVALFSMFEPLSEFIMNLDLACQDRALNSETLGVRGLARYKHTLQG